MSQAIIYGCLNASLAAFAGFLPVILQSFGYDSLHTQLLVVPIYVCAATAILIFAFISDRFRMRGILLIVSFCMAATGWIMIIVSQSRELSFAATFLVGMGSYPLVIISVAWVNNNVIGFTKRHATI